MQRSAKGRKGPSSGPVVAGRLHQGDQRLLLEVVGVAAGHEVGPGPGPGEPSVPGDELVEGGPVAGLEPSGEVRIGLAGRGDAGWGVDHAASCAMGGVRAGPPEP